MEYPAKDSSGRPVTKVYFSSAYRSKGTHSDLTWQIPGGETITTGPNCSVAFQDFYVGHSWYVVQDGVNNVLYVITKGIPTGGVSQLHYHSLSILEGNYTGTTLASAMQTALSTISDGTGATYVASFQNATSKIHVTQSSGYSFMIPNSVWLALNDFGGQRLSSPPSISNLVNAPDP